MPFDNLRASPVSALPLESLIRPQSAPGNARAPAQCHIKPEALALPTAQSTEHRETILWRDEPEEWPLRSDWFPPARRWLRRITFRQVRTEQGRPAAL